MEAVLALLAEWEKRDEWHRANPDPEIAGARQVFYARTAELRRAVEEASE